MVSALAPFLSRRAAREIVQAARMTLADRVDSLQKEAAEIAEIFAIKPDGSAVEAEGEKQNAPRADSNEEEYEDMDLFA